MARTKKKPIREQVIGHHTEQMATNFRIMNMIREIPVRVPIMFEHKTYNWQEKKTSIDPVAGIILVMNKSSFRLELIAGDGYLGYRPPTADAPLYTIRYDAIKTWRLLEDVDLGLMVGYEHKYPLFEAMLKDGFDAWKDKKNRYKKPEKEK